MAFHAGKTSCEMLDSTINYPTKIGVFPESVPTFSAAAIHYHRAGLVVVPAYRTAAGVITFPPNWGRYNDGEKQTEQDVQELFSRPSWGLAIVCTDGMEVIDIDEKHCPRREANRDFLKQILKTDGLDNILLQCVHVDTKSGGDHYIYRTEAPGGNKHLAHRAGGKQAIIETRGKGGLIFAAPTPGYKVTDGDYCNIPTITQADRDKLIRAAINAGDQVQEPAPPPVAKRPATTDQGRDYPYTFTDEDKVNYLIDQIERGRIDITQGVPEWFTIGLALYDAFGDAGETYFTRVSQYHQDFNQAAAKREWGRVRAKFSPGRVTIASFYKWCLDYGVGLDYDELKQIHSHRFTNSTEAQHRPPQGHQEPQKRPQERRKEPVNILLTKPAVTWMQEASQRPIPKRLFNTFWHQGEVCILFADTNLGKSILAVQIAEQIAAGRCTDPFTAEAPPQPIIYLDFELSDKQFENRYSEDYQNHYKFSDRFLRTEINPDAELPDGVSFEESLDHSLEATIQATGAKIIVIDNLTYLKTENEKSRNALPLMKHLKGLKNKYGLSILLLAHTPKRDLAKPISRNDLAGSKMLINFCDSAFAIGESVTDSGIRYLKQIKARNTEIMFDADNVLVCEISKLTNFLSFDFLSYGKESDHLRCRTNDEQTDRDGEVIALHEAGKSYRDIGKELGISHMTAKRIIEKQKESEPPAPDGWV